MPFIGFILIAMGLFAVGGTLYMVTREHQETEEWYVPPAPADKTATPPVVVAPTTAMVTPVPPPAPATADPAVKAATDADAAAKTE